MRRLSRRMAPVQAAILCLTIALTGCENGNLFGGFNDRGDSNDTTVLLADAGLALRENNYSQALTLYQRVLRQNPRNSEALYGASTAAMGLSGFNLGTIVTNITDQLNNSSSINGWGDLIASGRLTISNDSTSNVDSILFGLTITVLDTLIDEVVCWLQLIVGGVADGTINPNDPANAYVLLDLGLLCVIRSVLRFIREGWGDLVNQNGEISFVIDASLTTAICNDTTKQPIILELARDVIGAFALYKRAVELLAVSGNAVIVELRDEINDGVAQLLATGGAAIIPAACLTLLSNAGITLGSFPTDTSVFDNPPSSCPEIQGF